jgi:acetyltransferase-like isoleucine patch superfamily enzyme
MNRIVNRINLLFQNFTLREFSKNKVYQKISGSGNKLKYNDASLNINIQINGSKNLIIIGDKAKLNNLKIFIQGNDNIINISESVNFNVKGLIWVEDNNSILEIGRASTFEDATFAITENNSKIKIGEDCMFAYDIEVKNGDSHSIIDLQTHRRINFVKDVIIGNHVWVSAHAVLLKGSNIPDNCVVASNSVVTKSFEKTNVIIGGNPAHIIKEGISWDRKRLNY